MLSGRSRGCTSEYRGLIALQIGLATGEFRKSRYVRGGQSLDRRPPDSEDGVLAPTSSQGR